MKAVLKDGQVRSVRGEDIKEITVTVDDGTIIIVLRGGEVLSAAILSV